MFTKIREELNELQINLRELEAMEYEDFILSKLYIDVVVWNEITNRAVENAQK